MTTMIDNITPRHAWTRGQLLNVLRRGASYLATTIDGRSAAGRYLGIEVSYGDRSILLRNGEGTESIAVDELASLHPHAA